MTLRPAALLTACLLTACAPTRIALPSGAGAPFPGFAAAYAQAAETCRRVTTLTVSMALSGHAGQTKLRGRIDAGLAAPAQVRLEGFPPLSFGSGSYFTLVARGEEATLVLSRAGRVLRGARPAAILDALAGVSIGPAELRAVIAGCGLVAADPSAGRAYERGWVAVDVEGSTVFLRQVDGRWRVAAATRGSLSVEYADVAAGQPHTVRLRSAAAPAGTTADVILHVSQIEINVPLEPAVFDVAVPRDAVPITLEELRRAGTLGGS